jgi:uncharacterized protein YbaR (Trm112 family)
VFIELIDTLRCPRAHEDSWLVATSTLTEGRHLVTGALGCPVCRTQYAIVDAEVRFSELRATTQPKTFDTDAVFALAAQLHLVEAPAPVLLVGEYAACADALLRVAPHVRLIVADSAHPMPRDERISALRIPVDRLPLATGAVRGVALDAGHASSEMLLEAARVVSAGGRLVVPATLALDVANWTELARDTTCVGATETRAGQSAVCGVIRRAMTVA